MVMRELAKAMPNGGRVAMLVGNRAAENIRNRVSFLEGNFNVKSNGKGTFYNLVIPR